MSLLLCFGFLLLASCRTIPVGHVEGPIVKTTSSSPKATDGNAAVNHMVVAFVMRCEPVASAGVNKPRIINDFTAAGKGVDYLQMSFWNRVGEMNMIQPVATMSEKPQYKLASEIKPLPHPGELGENFTWNLVLTDFATGKKIWSESISFLHKKGDK